MNTVALFNGGPMHGQRRPLPEECNRLGLNVVSYDSEGRYGSYVTLRDVLDRPVVDRFGQLSLLWCGFHGRVK